MEKRRGKMKIFAYLLSFLLAAVLGAAIWIYYPQYQINQVKKEVASELHTFASENQVSYVDYFRSVDKQQIHHLALGDSIIKGFGANPNENLVRSFSTNLEEDIQKEVLYQNEGINEITSEELNELVQKGEFDEQIKKADIVTINIGGNDILHLGFEKGFYEAIRSFDQLQMAFSNNLSSTMNRINELNPDATVLLLELYNPLEQDSEFYSLADKILPKWNLKLYQLADEVDYAVVIETTDVINSEQPQRLSNDGVHPNGLGYEAISDKMITQLKMDTRSLDQQP
jgi:lysophospholipase L1-like esterase